MAQWFYYLFQIGLTGQSHIPSLSKIEFAFPSPDLTFFGSLEVAAKYFSIAFPFALLVILVPFQLLKVQRCWAKEYSPKDLLMIDGVATMLMGYLAVLRKQHHMLVSPAYKKWIRVLDIY